MCKQEQESRLTSPKTELADIFSAYQSQLPYVDDECWKVINAITSCRTAKLGGHLYKCDHCGHQEISYNSCRNRHCPKCQSLTKARWILERDRELLPVSYFHLVFTLPALFNPLILANKQAIYSLLFRVVSSTLKEVVANPENLGADCGFFAILHTWDQKLNLHPHLHCVVPGGGLSPDKTSWIASAKDFFVPVRKLSLVYRGKFLHGLEKLYKENQLAFPGKLAGLKDAARFKALLIESRRTNWVVYAKPPFRGAHWVLRYLARYTHRIAISNNRLICCEQGRVSFRYYDRKDGYRLKSCTMDAVLFMQKFLQHVLPPRFVRIRYYGFMANAVRSKMLAVIRELLGTDSGAGLLPAPAGWVEMYIQLTGKDPLVCRKCGNGRMVLLSVSYSCRSG